jgi:hypothetical protein
MPYVSEATLTFLNLSRKILPPQHIEVNPFSDYPAVKKKQRALGQHRFRTKARRFLGNCQTKIETYSMQEYIFQP